MTQIGTVGIVGIGVAVVAVENVIAGRDPFPQIMVGGLFAAAVSVVSEIDEGLAKAFAATFLVSVLLLHSKGITGVLTKYATAASKPKVKTTSNTKGKSE